MGVAVSFLSLHWRPASLPANRTAFLIIGCLPQPLRALYKLKGLTLMCGIFGALGGRDIVTDGSVSGAGPILKHRGLDGHGRPQISPVTHPKWRLHGAVRPAVGWTRGMWRRCTGWTTVLKKRRGQAAACPKAGHIGG
jgi:hypothetical protein